MNYLVNNMSRANILKYIVLLPIY